MLRKRVDSLLALLLREPGAGVYLGEGGSPDRTSDVGQRDDCETRIKL